MLELVLLFPVVGGSVYNVLTALAAIKFKWLAGRRRDLAMDWPPVTILKPIYGLEKKLEANLRSACSQDYPTYQVVLSVQRRDDPAIPLLREIEREYGPERVSLVIGDDPPKVNGKVQNLEIGLRAALHDTLVISDSDVLLRNDYLKTIVAPLADGNVGCVCTLYRAIDASTWYERLELLTLNADFTANLIFAQVTGASGLCLGASTALRRSTLDRIGGLSALADYMVEDYEMGRRIRAAGLKVAILPYFVDTRVNLVDWSTWWSHQVYWDQNTKAARPYGFAATVLTRSVPFALAFAAVRLFDPLGLWVLAAATAIRLVGSGVVLGHVLRDREGLASLALLPFRDITGLASWLFALSQRSFIWRGERFGLTRGGRIVPREV